MQNVSYSDITFLVR